MAEGTRRTLIEHRITAWVWYVVAIALGVLMVSLTVTFAVMFARLAVAVVFASNCDVVNGAFSVPN